MKYYSWNGLYYDYTASEMDDDFEFKGVVTVGIAKHDFPRWRHATRIEPANTDDMYIEPDELLSADNPLLVIDFPDIENYELRLDVQGLLIWVSDEIENLAGPNGFLNKADADIPLIKLISNDHPMDSEIEKMMAEIVLSRQEEDEVSKSRFLTAEEMAAGSTFMPVRSAWAGPNTPNAMTEKLSD